MILDHHSRIIYAVYQLFLFSPFVFSFVNICYSILVIFFPFQIVCDFVITLIFIPSWVFVSKNTSSDNYFCQVAFLSNYQSDERF